MKNLYWKLSIFIIIAFALFPKSVSATNIIVTGAIATSTTWSADTIKITGNTTVNDGVTLTINPGKYVIFQGHYGLYVQGRILAVGTPASKITFTAVNTTIGWSGIRFVSTPTTNDTSQLAYCNILYGKANLGTAEDYMGGGVFIKQFSKLIISNCIFSNNYAQTYGGAIACYYQSSPIIINNIICNNQSNSYGSAFYIYYISNPQVINNTIVNNHTPSGSGAFEIAASTPLLKNCIIYGNTSGLGNLQIYPSSFNNISYSDVWIASGVWAGTGNINANPVFVSPTAGTGNSYVGFTANWGLQSTTPCKDKGSLSLSSYLPTLDVAGNLRVDSTIVDMGALEYIESEILCGAITTSRTLSKYVIVTCDVTVNNNATLTVPPGAKIRFMGHYKLNVQGKLYAVGTSTSRITFTAANPTTGWSGIRFDGTPATNDTSRLVYCNIQYGLANSGSSFDMMGGAVFVRQVTKLVISNCNLSNNFASNYGGAIACYYYASPVIKNNTFSNNSTSNYGGAVSCYYYSSPVISYNTISNNSTSNSGGAIYCYYYSSPIINYNTIINNFSSLNGGAIFCRSYSLPVISTNTISNNYAGSVGGAIYCSSSSPLIIDNIISNNTVTSAGGAFFMSSNSNSEITNNTIVNNSASSSGGGGIYISSAYPIIKNCIIWGNTASYNAQIYSYPPNNTVIYSDVQGGYTGQGNINSDPMFVSPSTGSGNGYNGYSANWRLSSSTPCVNKGSVAPDNNLPLYDIYNNLRIDYDTVDIGASEYIQSTIVCGPISTNTSWSNSVIVNCNVSITSNAVLTISAGTKVKFLGQYSIDVVQGKVVAVGTQTNLIKFLPLVMSTGWYGIKYNGTIWAGTDSSIFEYCIFQGGNNNSTGINGNGGIFYISGFNKLLIRSCILTNNQASNNGGAIFCSTASPGIVNNLIVNNTAANAFGGGIYLAGSCSPLIANNTISNNASLTSGGGIYVNTTAPAPTPIIKNNIIYGNTCTATGIDKQLSPTTIASNVLNNNIEGTSAYPNNTGNSNNYFYSPLFKIASSGAGVTYEGYIGKDWSLQTSSQVINKGVGGALYRYGALTDLKGRPRVFGGQIDIGAYEDMSNINVCGRITQNTTWSATNIHVTCDVTVDNGVTLTIVPGTRVIFEGYYVLRVNGRLLAVGTPADTIRFYASIPATGWKGIRFDSMYTFWPNNNDTSKFMYCRFEHGLPNNSGIPWPSQNGGSFFTYNFDKIIISNSLFTNNNSVDWYGAAIGIYDADPIIRNCTFTKNSSYFGGAIYAQQFNGLIENCKFSNNSAVWAGGAIVLQSTSNAKIINTLIVNNSAEAGGGVYLNYNCAPTFLNNTISNNTAMHGGGFSCTSNSDPVIKNCIVWGNTASIEGNQFKLEDVASDPKIYYSDIQGGISAFGGTGSGTNYANIFQNNIDLSPSFISPTTFAGNGSGGGYNGLGANWRIQQGSPCINLGTPSITGLGLPAYDLDGKSRVYNGRIDMGAYENQQSIYACGTISSDKVWEADTIKVTCDILVASGATLTISPGTYVQFQGPYKLEVQGRLLAIGTADKMISFSIKDTTYFSRMDSFNRGGWKGIQFNSIPIANDSSKLIYCKISYGKASSNIWQNMRGGGIYIYNSNKLLISNCYISNNVACNSGSGIYIESSNPRILNSVICNNSVLPTSGGYANGGSVMMDDASGDFINNTIVNNINYYYAGLSIQNGSTPLIKNCIITNNFSNYYYLTYGQNWYADIMVDYNCQPNISNCIFSDYYTAYIWNVSNIQNIINGDPQFVTPSSGVGSAFNGFNADWSLKSTTPCLNAGTPSTSGLHLWGEDLAGRQRIIGDTIDLGAYEIQIHRKFITSHPVSVTTCEGTKATFSVSASINVGYQWQKNGLNIAGKTNRIFSIDTVKVSDYGYYRCLMSNQLGYIVSDSATLTVKTLPSITTHPDPNNFACVGGVDTLSVTASGSPTLTYQWYNLNGSVSGGSNSTYIINPVTSSSASTYRCIVSNGCGTATSNGATLTINSPVSVIPITSSNSICVGGTVLLSTLGTGTAPITYQWYKNGTAISGATGISYQILNALTTDAGNYYCKATNICKSDSTNTSTLTVNTTPNITYQSPADSVCIGQTKNFIISASSSLSISYQWHYNGTSNPISGATNNIYSISSVAATNGGTYYCKATNTCGTATTSAINFTVKTAPAITSQTSNLVLCPAQLATFSVTATGTAPITYKWYKDNTLISGATSSAYQINSVTATDAGNYYCAITNSCGTTNSSTKTLTVNVVPTITYQSAKDSVCLGQSKTFNITAAGSTPITYRWYKNGTATSDTITGAISNFYTISSVASSNGGTYYCKATNSCSSATTSAIDFTVKTAPSISSQTSNLVLCPTQLATFSVTATGTTPITYKWYKDNTLISGATSSTYQINSVTATDAANYYCAITNSCGTVNSSTKTLTVNVVPTITYKSPSDSVCLGQSKTFNITASGSAPITYRWYKNGTTTADTIAGAISNFYTISSVASTNGGTYYCKATNTCNSATTSAINFTVKTAPAITTQSSNQALCIGQQANFSVTATGTTPITYKWYKDNTLISGAVSSTYQISSVATTDAANYYCAITNSCGTVNSSTKTLTVNIAPTITFKSPNDSVCPGQSKTFNITATGSAPITYQWYKNGTATSDTISGATNNFHTISSVISSNGGTYYCKATNTCNSATTSAINLTVKTAPAITTQSSNQVLCIGQQANFSVTATGTAPITYKWYKDNTFITGATSSTYQISSVATTDAANYYCAVTNSCGTINSSTKTLTVNTSPTITYKSANDSVCQGQSKTFNITASGSAPITYQWYKNGTATSDTISGAINNFYTIGSVAAANGGTYYCKATNSCGSKTTSAMDLTIKTSPSITTQSSNLVLCVGQQANFSVSATGSAPITYKWYKDNTLITGAVSNTYQISSIATTDAAYYYCAITNSCGTTNSTTKTLTVNVAPTITYKSPNDSVCPGQSKTFNITATGSAPITYQWYKNGTATSDTISGATNNFHTISSVASSNGGTYYCKATNTCNSATTSAINLTVKSAPTFSAQSSNLVLCATQQANFSVTANGTAPLTYKWYKDNTLISGAVSSTYQISSVSASDAGNFYCAVSNSCGLINSVTKTLTVNVVPSIIYQSSSDSVCIGLSKSFNITATGSAPITYQWYKNGTANSDTIAGANNNFYTIISVVSANGGTYYCKATNSCGSKTTSAINLTVKTAPVITTQSSNVVLCATQQANFSVTATGTAPISYKWYKDNSLISGAVNSTYQISSVVASDAANYYCGISNSCATTNSLNKTLTVNVVPTITTQSASDSICLGNSKMFSIAATGSAPITYQWYYNTTSNAIAGANTYFYTINSVKATDGGLYYCKATNNCGTVTTSQITLSVRTAPIITAQSGSASRCVGQSQNFSVTATGSPTPTYQWYKDDIAISGATNNTYTISVVGVADGGNYHCLVSNTCDDVRSNLKTLTVNSPPDIIAQSPNTTRCSGQSITLDVKTIGTSPISYQWYHWGNPINGEVNNFFAIYNIDPSDSGTYYCIATNACGTDKSGNISLKVNVPISVYKQSRDTSKCVGDATLFNVQIHGTMPVNYSWYFQDDSIAGAHNNSYYISSVTQANNGTYFCKISNVCGSIDGAYKEITVRSLPEVHLGNDTTFCLGGSVELSSGGPYYCKWNNGSTQLNIIVTHSGTFNVHVTDPYGCKNYSDTVNITVIEPYPNQVLCVVTVDPISGKNLIAWERYRGYGIASYNIYKETSQTGVYQKIGSLPFDSLSVLIDYNSEPRKKSDRYAITVVDSCASNESDYSPFHKSIHLTANKGTSGENNLSWNHYEGFPFKTYKIYRGTNPTNLVLLDSVASNLNSFSDMTPPSGVAFYQVSAIKPDTCYPDITRAQTNNGPYSQSVSNLKDYSQVGTGYISASPAEANVGWKANSTALFNIYTNIPTWEASTTSNWLVLVKDYQNNVLKAIASENLSTQPRSDTIRITGAGVSTQYLIVHQGGTTGILEISPDIHLMVYPNPFNYSTNIEYELLKDADVNIEVYNMIGSRVASVIDKHQLPGKYIYTFNDAQTDGIYILRIVVNKNTYIKKLIKTE